MENFNHPAHVVKMELIVATDDHTEAEKLAEAVVDWVYGTRQDDLLTVNGITGIFDLTGEITATTVMVDEETRMISY